MPQKSIEQYERELIQMYRTALAKNPDYATLMRRQNDEMLQEQVSQAEKMAAEMPAPVVVESVPPTEAVAPNTQPPIMSQRPAVPLRRERPDEMPMREEPPAAQRQDASPESDMFGRDDTFQEPIEPDEPILATEPEQVLVVRHDSNIIVQPETAAEPQVLVGTETDNENEIARTPEVIPSEQPMPIEPQPPVVQPQVPVVPIIPITPLPAEINRNTATPNLGAGNLIVNVTTQNRTEPVQGATVAVRYAQDSANEVVAQVVTDESGKTGPIRLPAPIREVPVYPQPMIGGDLSAQYLITVEAPGYQSAVDEEILIFDGVTSIKRIDLESGTGREIRQADAADQNGADVRRE
ncbi:MAG: hypothetical protein ACK5L0_07845 [Candidatus Fimivivens sp.]